MHVFSVLKNLGHSCSFGGQQTIVVWRENRIDLSQFFFRIILWGLLISFYAFLSYKQHLRKTVDISRDLPHFISPFNLSEETLSIQPIIHEGVR